MIVCVSPAGSSFSSATGPTSELLVGTIDGTFALERSDSSHGWSIGRQSLAGSHVSSLVYVPERQAVYAGVYEGGLHVSDDAGRTWSRTPLDAPVSALALQQREHGTVLWAGADGALFRSDDAGATWSAYAPIPAPRGLVRHLAFLPGREDVLYVTLDPGGLYRSQDGGLTWRHVRADGARRLLAGKNGAKLYLAGTDGLFRSDDAGETWSALASGAQTMRELDHFFLDPRDEGTLYLVHGSEVLRSDDAGAAWTALREGLPDPAHGRIEALSMHRWIRTAGLFAGTDAGSVYASEERGVEWELAAHGLPPISRLRTPLTT